MNIELTQTNEVYITIAVIVGILGLAVLFTWIALRKRDA